MGFFDTLTNSLAGGVPGLIGNAIDAMSQSSANKTNMKINQMNNEFNERMMDKQIAYEKEMWQKNNEYNSASAQAQRWKDAGMNPTMMMGGANAGVASSGSVSAASAASPIASQPFRPDVNSIVQGIAQMQDLQIRDKVADAEIKQLNSQEDLNRAQANSAAEDVLSKKEYNKYIKENAKLDNEMKIQEKELQEKRIKYQDMMNAYQTLVNNGFDEMQAAQIAAYKATAAQQEFNSQGEIAKFIESMEKDLGFTMPEWSKGLLYMLFGLTNFVPKMPPITKHNEVRYDTGTRNTTINNPSPK